MVELESEGELSRSEVAAFLREFAAELEGGASGAERTRVPGESEESADERSLEANRITFVVGGESATVTVPEVVEFDVEVASRSPMFSSGVNQGIDLKLSWEIEDPERVFGDDQIEIE